MPQHASVQRRRLLAGFTLVVALLALFPARGGADDTVLRAPPAVIPGAMGFVGLPTDLFPAGDGQPIPIHVPAYGAAGNTQIDEDGWRTVREVTQHGVSFSWLKMFANFDPDAHDNPTVTGALALSSTIRAAAQAFEQLSVKVAVQSKEDGSRRAILQLQDPTSLTPVRKTAGDMLTLGVACPLISKLSDQLYSDVLVARFNLSPGSYAQHYLIDEAHREDPSVGYLSVQEDGRLALTPRFYPNDRIIVVQYKYCFVKVKEIPVTSWYAQPAPLGDYDESLVRKALPPLRLIAPVRPKALAAGFGYSLTVDGTGGVWGWGNNSWGEVGTGALSDQPVTPTRLTLPAPVRAVASDGSARSGAVAADGTVWIWGDVTLVRWTNYGRETQAFVSPAVQADRYGDKVWAAVAPRQVPDLTGVVDLAIGTTEYVALRQDGTVWVWGPNTFGQLGTGGCGADPAAQGCLSQDSLRPVSIRELSGVVQVAAGSVHVVALKDDGTVWVWGQNAWGELGVGSVTGPATCSGRPCSPQPVAVPGLTGVKAVAAGWNYTVALKDDGTVWAWGGNYAGAVGPMTQDVYATPVPVAGLDDVVAIAAGPFHALALKRDSTVWAWGANGSGQLGPAGPTQKSNCQLVSASISSYGEGCVPGPTPVQVPGLKGVSALAAGLGHSLAQDADGSIYAWGGYHDAAGTWTESPIPAKVHAR